MQQLYKGFLGKNFKTFVCNENRENSLNRFSCQEIKQFTMIFSWFIILVEKRCLMCV